MGKTNVTLKREPSLSNDVDTGTQHLATERIEALRQMMDMEAVDTKAVSEPIEALRQTVDTEAIRNKRSVHEVGTVMCHKN